MGEELVTKVNIERAQIIPPVKTAKFSSYKEKEIVIALTKNLKVTKYGLCEDYAPEVAEVRKKLLKVMKKAHADNKKEVCRLISFLLRTSFRKDPKGRHILDFTIFIFFQTNFIL